MIEGEPCYNCSKRAKPHAQILYGGVDGCDDTAERLRVAVDIQCRPHLGDVGRHGAIPSSYRDEIDDFALLVPEASEAINDDSWSSSMTHRASDHDQVALLKQRGYQALADLLVMAAD
jgi:hypothetical protein